MFLCCRAAGTPHRYQHTLYGGAVECQQQLHLQFVPPAELSVSGDAAGPFSQAQLCCLTIFHDVHPQEIEEGEDPIHTVSFDMEGKGDQFCF